MTRTEIRVPGGIRASEVHVSPVTATWKTPGSELAASIQDLAQVLGVYESVEPHQFTLFVLLEDDPDDVLHQIFEAERVLYGKFPSMPFDVRVTRATEAWDGMEPDERMVPRYQRRP